MVISLSKLRGNCFGSQKFQSSKPKNVFMLEPPSHIVCLTIWYRLLLEFWLVDTWFFARWRHQRAVTCVENVRQLNIRRGKKLGFQLSNKQPLGLFLKTSTWTLLIYIFFFYLGFLSQTFTIHGTAGEGGGYLFNPPLPLPPASQALRH